jgi:hypothetical protein
MKLFAGSLVAILFLGCGPAPPELKIRQVGFHDDPGPPLTFGLVIENVGGSAVAVDDVDAVVLDSDTIVGPRHSGKLADKIEVATAIYTGASEDKRLWRMLGEGESIECPPGERVAVYCNLAWGLPDNPPPALALVRAEFVVRLEGVELVRSEPCSFVMQSQAGWLDRILSGKPEPRSEAAEVVRRMDEMPGKKSKAFDDLYRFMGGKPSPDTM